MFENPTTRRVFLHRGLTMLAVGATVPTFLDQTVMAIANPLDTPLTQQPSGKDGKILVVVQLSGGNDGLNTVIPYGDDAYHRARPAIGHDPKTHDVHWKLRCSRIGSCFSRSQPGSPRWFPPIGS